MQKIFVLDTNVLLHDPSSYLSFGDNIVIIPIKVIEELDKFKGYNNELGHNARMVARSLDKLRAGGILRKGAKLSNGSIIKIIATPPDQSTVPDLSVSINDNDILITAYKLDSREKEKQKEGKSYAKVIFISKDLNARIKADVLGIQAENYEKGIVSEEKFYEGVRELSVAGDKIDSLYRFKELTLDNDDLKVINDNTGTVGSDDSVKKLAVNEFVILKDAGNENHSAIGKVMDSNKSIIKPITYDGQTPIWGIKPLNVRQKFAFEALFDEKISLVTLVGQAGTGKTLLAIASGLRQTVDEKKYSKVLIARPIIPMGKDIGFLPGSKDEKLKYWLQPIFDNLRYIFSTSHSDERAPDEAIQYLMSNHLVELEALTYIRGRSIPKQYVIIDEAQNLTPHEVKTIVSRAGEGSKIVLTGDPYQIDNPYLDTVSNGLIYLTQKLKDEKLYAHITFNKSERSALASLVAEKL